MTDNVYLKNIRCAWVTPVLGVNGQLLYWEPLLQNLASNFREFRVLTGEFTGNIVDAPFQIELCGFFKRLYQNDRISTDQSGRYVTGFSLSTPSVLFRLYKYQFDLVIINEFSLFAFYAYLIRLFRPATRVLCIVEASPRFRDPLLLRIARRLFRRLMTSFAHQFLTNNENARIYLKCDLGVSPEKITAKPYLVSDLSGPPACARQWNPHERPLIFIYAGDLVKRKGIHLAIKAFADLSDKDKRNARFQIVGNGPYRHTLQEQIHKYCLEKYVVFMERQPFNRMWALYDQADVLVFPTLGDYRALVPFEAMSRGAVILGSVYDGGVSETVSNGVNGFCLNPDDTVSFTEVLHVLINDPEMVAAFSTESIRKSQFYTLMSAINVLKQTCLGTLN